MTRTNDARRVWLAMTIAISVIASFVAGKAARDAIFLANFDVTSLPLLSGISAAMSVPLVIFAGRLMARVGPARLVPALNVISAALLVIEWSLLAQAPRAAALICFLHLGSLGAVLVSGFWSVVSERFDARTAKRYIARIGLGGTLGGIVGGVIAERTAVLASVDHLLLIVAGVQLFVALTTWRLAKGMHEAATTDESKVAWSALKHVSSSPLLRALAVVLVFGAIAAAALDYVFKAEVAHNADDLLRVLAVYHTVVNIATALLHVLVSRVLVTRFGVARSIGVLPALTALASGVAFAVPGMLAAMAARGVEMVMRSSVFRAAYELIYAPLLEHQKRASKVVLDVGAERIGDLLGALLIAGVIFSIAAPRGILLGCAALAATIALAFAFTLPRRYSHALAKSLVDRGTDTPAQVRATLAETGDLTTMSLVDLRASAVDNPFSSTLEAPAVRSGQPAVTDALAGAVEALRSGDAIRVRSALTPRPAPALAPFILPLLGWDAVASTAIRALIAIAPKCTGTLVDALLDPAQDFAIRRRMPAIVAAGAPALARWGLLQALADPRFEVRYRCARALGRLTAGGRFDREEILEVVRKELAVGSDVWRSYRLIDDDDDDDDDSTPDDASASLHHILRLRSELGLEHVFALLGLVFPTQPLQIALQSLYTQDRSLHATALEYLESILPQDLRALLWPLVEGQSTAVASRPATDVAEALRMSQPLIAEKLSKRANRK